MSANWFETGSDGVAREKLERERKRDMPYRFFIKKGQSAKIIFLDDFTRTRAVELPSGEVVQQPTVPLCFNEHNLTIDGDWKNWFTCLATSNPPCPICNANHYKYYIGMYSILASWVNDSGQEVWTKKIFPAKIDAIERVRMQQEAYVQDGVLPDKQFQHCMFRVMRTGERSAVTGDSLEFVKKLTAEQVAALLPQPQQGQEPLDINPYDYMKIFAPKDRADLEKLMQSGRVQPARKKTSGSAAADVFTSANSTVGSPGGDVADQGQGQQAAQGQGQQATQGQQTQNTGQQSTGAGGSPADSINF